MPAQLVYWHMPLPAPSCRAVGVRSAVMPGQRPRTLILVGTVAQFDECEDDIDETAQVPVRYRGRVMAAPIDALRLVG